MEEKKKGQSTFLVRTFKDSVFTHLFRQPEYTLELYRALHPEDQLTGINDIQNITHNSVLVNDIYNDLGFCVKDKLIVLVESQSTWSLNIIIRAFLYLSRTYEDYFSKHNTNLYNSKTENIPEPELYVIYTKERNDKPDWISLKDHFFDGKDTFLDVKIKVLFGDNKEDIIGQYVDFCKILDEQVHIYGPVQEAIETTIHICTVQDILTPYLENFKLEVIKMTDYLFNQEIISKSYEQSIRNEGRLEGRLEGHLEGCQEGRSQGIRTILSSLVNQGILSPEQAASQAKQAMQ